MSLSIRLAGLRGQMAAAFALRGAAAVFSFALNWLIARQFGADGVGSFAVALTTAIIASTVALAGVDYVLVRTVSIARSEGRTGLARSALRRSVRQAALFGVALGAAIFLGRELLARNLLGASDVAPFLGVMAALVPVLAATKLASSGLRASGKITLSQAIDGPIGTGLAAAVLGAAILLGFARSPLLPALLYTGFAALAAALGWLALRKVMRGWDAAAPHRESLLLAGLPILGVTVSNLFIDWFAMLTLSASASTAEAGIFRVAFQIVSTLNLLIVASESILAPVVAASYAAGDKERIAAVSRKSVLLLVAAAAPALLLILVAPGWLMGLFGPEFVAGAPVLQILALGQFVSLMTGPVGTILVMTKHERWSLAYAVVAAGLAAGLCLWLIPAYGLTGAAVAVAATMIFRRLAALAIVRQVIGIHFFRRNLA